MSEPNDQIQQPDSTEPGQEEPPAQPSSRARWSIMLIGALFFIPILCMCLVVLALATQ